MHSKRQKQNFAELGSKLERRDSRHVRPGLPDGTYILKPKNTNFGSFWRALEWNRLVYSMATWNILRPFGTFYGYLVNELRFGIFSPVLVQFAEKNLATVRKTHIRSTPLP
jgi:hypothetical protein